MGAIEGKQTINVLADRTGINAAGHQRSRAKWPEDFDAWIGMPGQLADGNLRFARWEPPNRFVPVGCPEKRHSKKGTVPWGSHFLVLQLLLANQNCNICPLEQTKTP